MIITHNISTKPDRIQTTVGLMRDIAEASPNELSYDNNVNGDFYFADNEKEFSYLGKLPYIAFAKVIYFVDQDR